MLADMILAGQEFTEEIIERIRESVETCAELTRTTLSRLVCVWMGWLRPNGAPKEASCRAALRELERRGVIELPRPRVIFTAGQPTGEKAPEWVRLRASLKSIGDIQLLVV